jgi:intein/homing endonuclease
MKYIPASSFAILNLTDNNHRRIMEKYKHASNWWEPKAFFRHKYLLISAYHGIKFPDFRNRYRIQKDIEVFGDSVTGDITFLYKEHGAIKLDTFENFYKKRISQLVNNKWQSLVGIEVLSKDKNNNILFKKATQIKRHNTNKKVYEIRTVGGRDITVTSDHSLYTLDDNYNIVEIKGSDIKKGDYIIAVKDLQHIVNKEENTSIDDDFLIFLGMWYGDGYIESQTVIGLSSPEKQIRIQLKKLTDKYNIHLSYSNNDVDISFSSKYLRSTFKDLEITGKANTKKIPAFIFS